MVTYWWLYWLAKRCGKRMMQRIVFVFLEDNGCEWKKLGANLPDCRWNMCKVVVIVINLRACSEQWTRCLTIFIDCTKGQITTRMAMNIDILPARPGWPRPKSSCPRAYRHPRNVPVQINCWFASCSHNVELECPLRGYKLVAFRTTPASTLDLQSQDRLSAGS